MGSAHIELPALPPKSCRRSRKHEFIETRRHALEVYVRVAHQLRRRRRVIDCGGPFSFIFLGAQIIRVCECVLLFAPSV